jgi:hypothetical protein
VNTKIRDSVPALCDRAADQSTSRALRFLCWAARPVACLWHMAEQHGLNPWFFIVMSVVGYAIQSMIYLPPFQSQAWRLAFLILLRVAALVIPAYILLKGKGIARAFNGSVTAMFILNTTWHVCYFVYL